MRLLLILLATVGGLAAAAVLYDLRRDRQHRIELAATTPLFAGARLDCGRDTPAPIGFANPGDHIQVLRIRYGKDCETIHIRVADGPSGWLLVDGSVVVR
jgi:hypothetical protein